jgi:DNA-binding ferritin-like protein (Dps family)
MGRMFCMQCGASVTAARPESKPEQSVGTKVGAFISRIFRLVIVLGLTFLIALLLWPLSPTGMEGNLKDAQLLQQKLELVKRAAMEDKTATQRFSEPEINAHLDKLLQETVGREPADAFRYQLRKVNVELTEQRAVATLLAAWGPVNLSYQVAGRPAIEGSSFVFRVEEARMGHMRMPGFLRGWLASRVAVVFSQRLDERSTLEQMDALEVGQGELVVTHKGR